MPAEAFWLVKQNRCVVLCFSLYIASAASGILLYIGELLRRLGYPRYGTMGEDASIVQIEGVRVKTSRPLLHSYRNPVKCWKNPASDPGHITDLRCKVSPMFWVRKVEKFGMLV